MEDLEKRPHAIGGSPTVSENDARSLLRKIKGVNLPTKFEDPISYLILTEKISAVEEAIGKLSLTIPSRPKFGTLPTAEINARAVPVPLTNDRLIVLNTQTFSFNYEMTKTVLPTVGIRNENEENFSLDLSPENALQIIRSDATIRRSFVDTLLDFLLIAPAPSRIRLDQTYDPAIIKIVDAMELFQVGHEYGHVIRQHPVLRIDKLQLASDPNDKAPIEVSAVTRSWTNELEADFLGFKIMVQAIKSKNQDFLRIYAMSGPLLFMEYMDILDRAKYLIDHGSEKPPLSKEERVQILKIIRQISDPQTKSNSQDQNASSTSILAGSHPPAWLRALFIDEALNKQLAQEQITDDEKALGRLAGALIQNMELLWKESVPDLMKVHEALKLNSKGH